MGNTPSTAAAAATPAVSVSGPAGLSTAGILNTIGKQVNDGVLPLTAVSGGTASQPIHVTFTHTKSWGATASEIMVALVPAALIYHFVMKPMLSHILKPDDAQASAKGKSAETKRALLAKARASGRDTIPDLNDYEELLLSSIVFPHEIVSTFDDIGGLERLKHEIYETVILPLQSPELFASLNVSAADSVSGRRSQLLAAPGGVLFYGPPGTGKTMMARAVAKACNATFINISLSSLQSKWYGESQRLCRAIFTLGQKFAPSIIFLDEIDLFLRKRSQQDHEASAASKAEFMTQWDGLTSSNASSGVTVLAATNRPWDIDDAVLRRLSRQLMFDLPSERERAEIMSVLMRDIRYDDTVDFEDLAAATGGYSGSDLKEVCRVAAMTPIRDLIAQHRKAARMASQPNGVNIDTNTLNNSVARPVSQADLLSALATIEPTGQESVRYLKEFQAREASRMRRG